VTRRAATRPFAKLLWTHLFTLLLRCKCGKTCQSTNCVIISSYLDAGNAGSRYCSGCIAAAIIAYAQELSQFDRGRRFWVRRLSRGSYTRYTDPITPGKRSSYLPRLPESGRGDILSSAADCRMYSSRLRQLFENFNHTHTDSCAVIGCNVV